MLHQTDAELIIDRKDFSDDKFDDLKVKTPNGNFLIFQEVKRSHNAVSCPLPFEKSSLVSLWEFSSSEYLIEKTFYLFVMNLQLY